ncbi:DNA topoisomerase [Shewanella colwelliana]|uniref:DNA topoisomerase n=1 Tax=Shewanella colwelliana TaxID=23 RepID=UPI0027E5BAE6|nr:DNA topoisomerase [Shewanella colwelliana]
MINSLRAQFDANDHTDATRASIIELLFNRGYLLRQGKSIIATPVGIGLINSLPESATTPDMTALWESSLDAISQKQLRYDAFMEPLLTQLHQLIEQASNQLPTALQGVAGPGYKSKYKKSRGAANNGYKRKASLTKSSATKNSTTNNATKSAGKAKRAVAKK